MDPRTVVVFQEGAGGVSGLIDRDRGPCPSRNAEVAHWKALLTTRCVPGFETSATGPDKLQCSLLTNAVLASENPLPVRGVDL